MNRFRKLFTTLLFVILFIECVKAQSISIFYRDEKNPVMKPLYDFSPSHEIRLEDDSAFIHYVDGFIEDIKHRELCNQCDQVCTSNEKLIRVVRAYGIANGYDIIDIIPIDDKQFVYVLDYKKKCILDGTMYNLLKNIIIEYEKSDKRNLYFSPKSGIY